MTKKFLAVTLVLILAAGFAAVAQEDERPLMGSWNNTLTLDPNTSGNPIAGFDSTLDVTYTSGGVTYNSESVFDETGFVDQTFGVETTVGLLDLSSTANFDPSVPGLDYWLNSASLTLGGVSITDDFLLQDTKDGLDDGYGAGMNLMFSGETPGGVSVDVENYFGMEPVSYSSTDGTYYGDITGIDYGYYSVPADSGYGIVGIHEEGGDDIYGPSAMQYVGTMLTLENLSLGCCDFSSETLFSEMNGFEYTLFEFTIESSNWPLSLDGDLMFEEQTKSIYLTPSLETNWACFEVYTDLSGTLANNGTKGSTIDGLIVKGFAITDVELGHVKFSSYTALGEYTVYDLNDVFRESYTYGGVEVEETEYFDEVIRIEKLDKFPLSFTGDVYFDMTESNALFDLALFELDTSYELSDQFSIGNGLLISPKTEELGGLEEVTLSLDYSF